MEVENWGKVLKLPVYIFFNFNRLKFDLIDYQLFLKLLKIKINYVVNVCIKVNGFYVIERVDYKIHKPINFQSLLA